jgi:hypothetical protein
MPCAYVAAYVCNDVVFQIIVKHCRPIVETTYSYPTVEKLETCRLETFILKKVKKIN